MGGRSPEREVSLKSGENVAKALLRLGHKVAAIDPAKEISVSEPIFRTELHNTYTDASLPFSEREIISDGAMAICRASDIVFLALHGGDGENGRLQALFDAFGVRYTGSGAHSSACAMDKISAKRIYCAYGIPTPEYTVCGGAELPYVAPELFPCVIKPANGGSSVGISFAENEAELLEGLKERKMNAPKTHETLLIERKIFGKELTVGVLQDQPLTVTEIIPKQGFYDFENKYVIGRTEEITPAPITNEQTEMALRLALSAHRALGLKNFSRTDMILENKSGRLYVLETNTLPGMTETSLLPMGAAACGIDFDLLCQKMLD